MIKDINKKIGKKIAELRKDTGLSQAQLAEKAGFSSEYISRLERGVNAPSVKALNKMSDYLNVSVRDMLSFSETDEWYMEIEALVVLMKNKQGKSIRKVLKLSEVQGE